MRDSGKITAAIEILTDFTARRVPVKTCLKDWARNARYAGAKDRAWISGLALDALRKKNSITAQMQDDSPRALVLGALHFLWGVSLEDMEAFLTEEPHGAGALTEQERKALQSSAAKDLPLTIAGDFPNWLEASIKNAFENPLAEMQAFAARASVDLRINTLKADIEKARKATASVKARASDLVTTGLSIAPPPASMKASAVETIPAFSKGWVEVQDIGSQLCALAAGDIKGKQVLDFCAGGGGKTLALSAMMGNSGQIHAYDIETRRLAPLFHRGKRAGMRNCQILDPKTSALDELKEKMDVVFIDAPCSGSGTWRRRPDTKWRLSEQQLQTRMREQDQVLRAAAQYVKPGGQMIYVTCSFLHEENEDRLQEFLADHEEFSCADSLANISASGLLCEGAEEILQKCKTKTGALRLSPLRTKSDGFFVQALQRRA
jgi:16S rRNA (cytosine967-C5)-methyltransferase